ncbi:MAG: aminotransferase class V-fold PLP-dependent enzyme [Flavobacteriaceae bacterium]|jgi:kynureninase|nr:aminotransferase class V-fold PLP-dependent enzyme [Flavobacteriaceae bacterium]
MDINQVKQEDEKDPLSKFRAYFFHPKNELYFDGNSLGKLPLKAQKTLHEVIQNQWGEGLIRSWNRYWLDIPKKIGAKYAQLLGVEKEEISIGESTSVRLYQILHALISSGLFPKHLTTDILNFPTDLYVMEGLKKNFEISPITVVSYPNEIEADIEKLKRTIKNHPGIICLSLVSYKSAFLYPMRLLNRWAAKHSSIIVWDLSHAIGAVAIDLKKTETKIALGCTYKYMNGGPGAPAFLYVNKIIQTNLFNPIQGWFGHQRPFDFEKNYIPAQGIGRFASGTPAILSMAAMEAGVDIVLEAGIESLRNKSVLQSELLLKMAQEELIPLGFLIESPIEPEYRGSHVTLSHDGAWQICQALLAGSQSHPKIIPDFRPPNFIRFGITPLYTQYRDLWTLVDTLKTIMNTKSYLNFSVEKTTVT